MALSFSLTYTQGTTVEAGTITDATVYGTPNDDRADRGNYLLLSENDNNGTRTYLSVTNTTPLSTLSWAFTSNGDGWHQATLLSVSLWDSGTSYIEDDVVFYTVTGLFYTALQANSNVAPDSGSGPANWQEVTDFTAIQQDHTNLEVFDFNFLITSRTDLRIADKFYEIIKEDFTCKLTLDDAANPLNLIAMMEGAESKELDGKLDQADQIIDAISECVE